MKRDKKLFTHYFHTIDALYAWTSRCHWPRRQGDTVVVNNSRPQSVIAGIPDVMRQYPVSCDFWQNVAMD